MDRVQELPAMLAERADDNNRLLCMLARRQLEIVRAIKASNSCQRTRPAARPAGCLAMQKRPQPYANEYFLPWC